MTRARPKLVFATFNEGKVREACAILKDIDIEVLPASAVGITSLPDETAESFVMNALIKASYVFRMTGLPTIADDSGLEVNALNGAPGVHSARYAGDGHDHDANIDKLLHAMRDVMDRSARFVCHIVLVGNPAMWPALLAPLPQGLTRLPSSSLLPSDAVAITSVGEVRGLILRERRGSGGFGYDPVFFHEGEMGTFAEIDEERKNALSHRGAALKMLKPLLMTLGAD